MPKKTTVELLKAYYTETPRRRPVLSSTQEKIRQRLVNIHALILDGEPLRSAILTHMERYGIVEMQAYRDYRHALQLFGDVLKAEKEGMRHLVQQMALEVYAEAKKRMDLKTMDRALNTIIRVGRLDQDDSEAPDFSKLEPGLIVTALPDEDRMRLQRLLGSGAVDFSGTAQETPMAQYRLDEEE